MEGCLGRGGGDVCFNVKLVCMNELIDDNLSFVMSLMKNPKSLLTFFRWKGVLVGGGKE